MFKKLWQGLKSFRRGDEDVDWSLDERRHLVRMRCHYDVQYRLVSRDSGRKQHPGTIVDMSLGGMKLRCFQAPKVGDTVEVTYSVPTTDIQESTIPCKVEWVRHRERDFVAFVGLAYDASKDVMKKSWVKMLLKQLGFQSDKVFQRRKFVRAECIIPTKAVYQRVETLDGRLYNLGAAGALLEARRALPEGEFVELQVGPFEDLPRLDVTGTVVQVNKQHANYLLGVEFGVLSERATTRLGEYIRHLLTEHWEA